VDECYACYLKAQPGHPGTVMVQSAGVGWPSSAQPQMIGMTQPTPQQSMRPVNTPNDPFGSLWNLPLSLCKSIIVCLHLILFHTLTCCASVSSIDSIYTLCDYRSKTEVNARAIIELLIEAMSWINAGSRIQPGASIQSFTLNAALLISTEWWIYV